MKISKGGFERLPRSNDQTKTHSNSIDIQQTKKAEIENCLREARDPNFSGDSGPGSGFLCCLGEGVGRNSEVVVATRWYMY